VGFQQSRPLPRRSMRSFRFSRQASEKRAEFAWNAFAGQPASPRWGFADGPVESPPPDLRVCYCAADPFTILLHQSPSSIDDHFALFSNPRPATELPVGAPSSLFAIPRLKRSASFLRAANFARGPSIISTERPFLHSPRQLHSSVHADRRVSPGRFTPAYRSGLKAEISERKVRAGC